MFRDAARILRRAAAWGVMALAFCATSQAAQFRVELFGLTDSLHRGPGGETTAEPVNSYRNSAMPSPRQAVLGDSYQLATGPYPGFTPWIATSGAATPLGLHDAAHTMTDGRNYSSSWLFAGASNIAGYSNRFDGEAVGSAWHYNGTTSRQIGLWNAAGKPASPHAVELPDAINAAGQVAGEWQSGFRFHHADFSQWIWVFDGATTQRVGLPRWGEAEDSWAGINQLSGFNAAGQAIGYSDGGFNAGDVSRAWFYDGEATHDIGLADSRHTDPLGGRASVPAFLTDSGTVIGSALNFSTESYSNPDGTTAIATYNGMTPWIYRNGATRVLGLSGDGYIGKFGETYGYAEVVADNGWSAGASRRFDVNNEVPWIDDGVTTHAISLPGVDWSQDYQISHVLLYSLSEAGRVVGDIASGSPSIGDGVFAAQNGQARWLGLFGDEYRDANGRTTNSFYQQVGDAVVGATSRYRGSLWIGQTAWYDDGAATQPLEIALPDDDPTLERQTHVRAMNSAGQVLGVTYLVDDRGDELANRPWVFDPGSGLTPIDVPAGETALLWGFTEDGWAYGQYGHEYDENGYWTDARAFVWQKSAGWIDLEDAATLGSPEAVGSRLYFISGGNDGAFVGVAATGDGGTLVFRATAVPEPGAGVILGVIALGAWGLFRRATDVSPVVK